MPACKIQTSDSEGLALKRFAQMREEGLYLDRELVSCDGARRAVHGVLMAMWSKQLGDALMESPAVELRDVDCGTLDCLMNLFYHSALDVEPDNVSRILCFAQTFGIPKLTEHCCRYMRFTCLKFHAADRVHPEKALGWAAAAARFKMAELGEICNRFARFHFRQLAAESADVLSGLALDHMVALVSADSLRAPEEVVFGAVLDWIGRQQHAATRRASALILFAHVRFDAMEGDPRDRLPEELRGELSDLLPLAPCPMPPARRRARPYNCERRTLVIGGHLVKRGPEARRKRLIPNGEMGQMFAMPKGPTDGFSRGHPLPMGTGKGWKAVEMLGGYVYLMGGIANSCPSAKVWRLDPWTGDWKEMCPMPRERVDFAAAALNGKIYVVGGRLSREAVGQGWTEAYDPLTDSWRILEDCPVAVLAHAAESFRGHIYVCGGIAINPVTGIAAASRQLWRFDPSTNSWRRLSDMPFSRYEHGMFLTDSGLLCLGGRDLTVTIYDPPSDTWYTPLTVNQPPLSSQRNAAVCKMGQKILLVGGGLDAAVTFYDTAARTWGSYPELPLLLEDMAVVTATLPKKHH